MKKQYYRNWNHEILDTLWIRFVYFMVRLVIFSLRYSNVENTCHGSILSCECKKGASAFLSFCSRSHFVHQFLLYFIVLWCLISFVKKNNIFSWDLHYDLTLVFLLTVSRSLETWYHPKCQLQPCYIHAIVWLYGRSIAYVSLVIE